MFSVSVDRGFGETGTPVLFIPIQEINEGAAIGPFAVRAIDALDDQIDDGVPVVLRNKSGSLHRHADMLCQFLIFVNSFC